MKKIIAIIVLSLCIISLAYSAGTSEDGKAKIGAILPSLSFDFQLNMSKGIERAAEENGYTAVINDYNADPELMLTGLETMKAMGVKALYSIFLSPQLASDFMISNPDIAVLNQSMNVEGIKARTMNDYEKLGKQFIDALENYVTANNINSGEIAGLWLETCEIEDTDYHEAMLTIQSVIDKWCATKNGNFQLTVNFFPRTEEDAANMVTQILNGYPDVKIFFCHNNGYAIAASNEIASAKADTSDYFVFSSEGDNESFRLIANGTTPYRACAYANIEESGYKVGLQLINWIENGKIENVPIVKDLVDSRNVNEYL